MAGTSSRENRLLSSRWLIASLLVASGAPALAAAATDAADLPHRSHRLAVDGDPSDWGDSGLRFEIRRPDTAGEPLASAVVRLAWDRRALWALFEVSDTTPSEAPAAAGGAELFQWDSVEIYIDGRGDRSARMGADDFQVILAPDGRFAVLQGDPLLLEIEELEVPKRERPAVALEAVGWRGDGSYVVECAIPFAALGVAPGAGATLAFDLAVNDWLADHVPARQLHFDLETLRKLDHRPGTPPPDYTFNGLEVDPAAALEARLYRPWSLAGNGDFGHPRQWRLLRLAGGPPFADRVVDALGPGWTLAGGAATALLLVAITLAAEERRHRRRIVALFERIARIDAETSRPSAPWPAAVAAAPAPAERPAADESRTASGPAPAAESVPSPVAAPVAAHVPMALEWLEHAVDHGAAGDAGERFELRALRAIRGRIGAALTPADLAAALFVSLRTLERHVGEALGCSPGELILAVKMREARRLLDQGGLQVQEIAHRVGYEDPAHFSRRFKVYFGSTPAAWRHGGERSPGPRRMSA